MIYVLSVCGYETYMPVWFETDFINKQGFKNAVQKAMKDCLPALLKSKNKKNVVSFIDGSDLLNAIVKVLQTRGFRVLEPVLEIDIKGETTYEKDRPYERPEIMQDDVWGKITKHNDIIQKKWLEDGGKELKKIEEKETMNKKEKVNLKQGGE